MDIKNNMNNLYAKSILSNSNKTNNNVINLKNVSKNSKKNIELESNNQNNEEINLYASKSKSVDKDINKIKTFFWDNDLDFNEKEIENIEGEKLSVSSRIATTLTFGAVPYSNNIIVSMKNGIKLLFDKEGKLISYTDINNNEYKGEILKKIIDVLEENDFNLVNVKELIIKDNEEYKIKLNNDYIYDIDEDGLLSITTKENIKFYVRDNYLRCAENNINIYELLKNEYGNGVGGDQNIFSYRFKSLIEEKDIKKILKNYFPNASQEDYRLLFSKINKVGCAYTALVNSIFETYANDAAKFYKTFGFSMYKILANGSIEFNYEPLILSLFLYTWVDKKGYDISKIYGSKEVSGTSWIADIYPNYNILSEFLKDKYNINATIEYKDVEKINNYDEWAKNGKAVIYIGEGYDLYNLDNSSYTLDGGSHAMSIIDVKSNGEIHVSSWGKEYILNIDNVKVGNSKLVLVNINK